MRALKNKHMSGGCKRWSWRAGQEGLSKEGSMKTALRRSQGFLLKPREGPQESDWFKLQISDVILSVIKRGAGGAGEEEIMM